MANKTVKGGWMGKVLHIDLSTHSIAIEELNREMVRKHVGGAGIGVKFAYDYIKPGMEPFDEDMPVLFITGPLTGTHAPTSGAYTLLTKSPVTKTIAMANSNGFFGARLKAAGFDYVVVRGKSEKPVYLWINDGNVEFKDASDIWQCNVNETQKRIMDEIGEPKASIACIGSAGANMVKYASVVNDFYHIASSGGIGAVLGSKTSRLSRHTARRKRRYSMKRR